MNNDYLNYCPHLYVFNKRNRNCRTVLSNRIRFQCLSLVAQFLHLGCYAFHPVFFFIFFHFLFLFFVISVLSFVFAFVFMENARHCHCHCTLTMHTAILFISSILVACQCNILFRYIAECLNSF